MTKAPRDTPAQRAGRARENGGLTGTTTPSRSEQCPPAALQGEPAAPGNLSTSGPRRPAPPDHRLHSRGDQRGQQHRAKCERSGHHGDQRKGLGLNAAQRDIDDSDDRHENHLENHQPQPCERNSAGPDISPHAQPPGSRYRGTPQSNSSSRKPRAINPGRETTRNGQQRLWKYNIPSQAHWTSTKDPSSRPQAGPFPCSTFIGHPQPLLRNQGRFSRTCSRGRPWAGLRPPGRGNARTKPDSACPQDLGAKPQTLRPVGPLDRHQEAGAISPGHVLEELKAFLAQSSPGPDPPRGQNRAKFTRH